MENDQYDKDSVSLIQEKKKDSVFAQKGHFATQTLSARTGGLFPWAAPHPSVPGMQTLEGLFPGFRIPARLRAVSAGGDCACYRPLRWRGKGRLSIKLLHQRECNSLCFWNGKIILNVIWRHYHAFH